MSIVFNFSLAASVNFFNFFNYFNIMYYLYYLLAELPQLGSHAGVEALRVVLDDEASDDGGVDIECEIDSLLCLALHDGLEAVDGLVAELRGHGEATLDDVLLCAV